MPSLRAIILLGVLGIAVAGVAAWQAEPLYRWYERQRALSLLDTSQSFLAEKDIVSAAKAAEQAYRMAPDEPEVIRSLARLYRLDGGASKEALYLLNKLTGMETSTTDDRRELIRTLALIGDLEKAQLLTNELLLEDPNDPKNLSLQARLLIADGEVSEGLKLLRKAQEIDPGNEKDRLLFAQLLIEFGTFEEKSQAWMMLKEISRSDTSTGTKALELLRRNFNDPGDLHPQLIAPPAEERGPQPQIIVDLKREFLLEPERKHEILERAFARFQSMGRMGTGYMGHLTRWLYRQGENELIIEYLPWEKVKDDASLAPIYLSALGRMEDWRRVKELLEEEDLALDDIHREVYLAYAGEKLELGVRHVKRHLHAALEHAISGKDFEEALSVGNYAERLYFYDIAREAYRFAKGSRKTVQRAYEHLLAMDDIRTDGQAQRRLTEEFLERFPNKQDLRQRYIYLKLLMGIEVELAQHEMERLLPEATSHNSARMVLALAYYRMGDVEAARQIAESASLADLSTGHKAVYALIMHASARPELARNIVRTLAVDLLLDEEKRLVSPILSSQTAAAN